mgnify:CR=1 FL=1|jgi:hypothetical protein
MANTYYSISLTAPIADIKAALIAKYSGGVTTYYTDANNWIFSCPAISDKVLKIYFSSGLCFYYGDAWTSGSTITNSVQFAGYNVGTTSIIHLVLGTNLFYMCYLQTTILSGVVVIAKMSNNNYICLGLSGTNQSYNTYCRGRDTTSAVDIVPISLSSAFMGTSNKLYKQSLLVLKLDGTVEVNSDGSLASIVDLYSISYITSTSTLLKSTSYLMSSAPMYMSDGKVYLLTSLFAEF